MQISKTLTFESNITSSRFLHKGNNLTPPHLLKYLYQDSNMRVMYMCVGVIDFAFVFYTISLIDLCFACHFITCFRVKLISCKNNIHLKTNTLWSVSWSEYYIQIMHICIDCRLSNLSSLSWFSELQLDKRVAYIVNDTRDNNKTEHLFRI